MAYSTIRNGSSGSDVKTWQKYLISQGYDVGSTGADGKFGSKTLAATKQYQKDKGLTVDGIVGKNTWGSISSGKSTTKTTTTKPKTTTPKFTYADYEKSDIVKQAEDMVQQQIANKPGEYSSNWQTQLDDTMNKILNREKFTYDLNGDALYQQYKDQYMLQGQQAMMDTMGQAQAMTGGYGNSYAQTVGQQTYQGHLQELNDRIPELYQLALNQYNQEGQDLYNQYSLYADRENQDYGRYRDSVSDYYTELDVLTDEARYQSETDYNRYVDDRNYDYTVDKDAEDKAYETAMAMISVGATPSAALLEAAGISSSDAQLMIKKVNADKSKSSGGSGSGGGQKNNNGGNNNGYDNSGYDAEMVKLAQKFVGASADGKWGANSTAKAKAMGYNSIEEVVKAMNKPDASAYADWDAGDWEGYFARIRQSEGKAAAEEELRYFTSNGLIPHGYVSYAAIGVRGGAMGH